MQIHQDQPMKPVNKNNPRTTMEMEKKCGCWSVLKRGVRGACKPSASRDSANTIPRTSLVHDAGIVVYAPPQI